MKFMDDVSLDRRPRLRRRSSDGWRTWRAERAHDARQPAHDFRSLCLPSTESGRVTGKMPVIHIAS